MTETPETPPPPPPPPVAKPNRLFQVAAWVVIIAGTVFVAAVVFCTGVYLSDNGWQGDRHGPCMMHHHGPPMGPGFGPAGPGNEPGWPGFRPAGPGNGPGGPGGPPPPPPVPPHR